LPERFTAKMLYGWSDKQYDQEYWGRLKRNWKRWKGKRPTRREVMKTIPEEEKIEEEKSGVREWTEEDDDEMGNMVHVRAHSVRHQSHFNVVREGVLS